MVARVRSRRLRFRPPYDWLALVGFLGARSIEGVEGVSGGAYCRAMRIERAGAEDIGWIAVTPVATQSALRVDLSPSLSDAVEPVLARVRQVMDLAADPEAIASALGPLAARRPGLRVPGAFDGFEIAVRAILGQQISVKAARTIAGRFAAAFGTAVETPFAEIARVFPSASDVAERRIDRIASLGIIASRARTIRAIARAMVQGELVLTPGVDVEATLGRLRALPGVGEWTAQYIAMRALAWRDAFPHTDLGIRKALGEEDPKRVLAAGEAWRPWRAYAAMHLWLG